MYTSNSILTQYCKVVTLSAFPRSIPLISRNTIICGRARYSFIRFPGVKVTVYQRQYEYQNQFYISGSKLANESTKIPLIRGYSTGLNVSKGTAATKSPNDKFDFSRAAGFLGLGVSFAVAIGASLLVFGSNPKSKNENSTKHAGESSLQYRLSNISSEEIEEARRRLLGKYSTRSIGTSVNVEAITVAEEITKEALLERYEFLEGTKSNPKKRPSQSKQIQVIGKGAFGKVVRARDRLSGAKVAVKIVPHDVMSAEALLNEVEVLRRVRGHDNIIHISEVLKCRGEYYLVTELCEGGELLDRLRRSGPYDEESAASLIFNVASAIQHIHNCGYVHLDIKPENLVFPDADSEKATTSNGKKKELKLPFRTDCRIIDFGMAKKIEDIEGTKIIDRFEPGARVGTLAYCPPEILRIVIGILPEEDQDFDEFEEEFREKMTNYNPSSSDMWALGVVLYITLLGCHPFDPKGRGNEDAIIKAVINGRYRFDIHGKRLQISEEAQDLISGLLDPNPATRFTPEDVRTHAFIRNRRQAIPYLDKLPSSWVESGFQGNRTSEVDAAMDNPDKRLAFFQQRRMLDAYVRAILIATLANGGKKEGEIIAKNSEELYMAAFKAIDTYNVGKITLPAINALLFATGEDLNEQNNHAIKPPPESANIPEDKLVISFEEFKAILRKCGCVSRTFNPGTPVFSQGSQPQGFYVLTKGRAQLEYTEDDNGSESTHNHNHKIRDFAEINPGSIIGETALDQGRKERSVTCRCTEPSEVFYVPKAQFFRALAGSPALQTRLFQVARLQQAKRIHGLIEKLNPRSLHIEKYKKGDIIFKQGDRSELVYFIRKGIVAATVTAGGTGGEFVKGESDVISKVVVPLSQRGPGDFIGSSSFAQQGKRYCTAKCVTDVEATVMNHADIEDLTKKNKTLQFYFENQAQWRKHQWEERVADVERGVTEPQLLPLLFQMEQRKESPEMSAKKTEKKKIPWWYFPFIWNREGELGKKNGSAYEEFKAALSKMESKSYKAGDAIFNKGERPERFFIVNSGIVAAEYTCDTGEVMKLAQFEPGDHFGEQSLLEHRPEYVSTVRCVTNADILSMSKEEFMALIGDGHTPFAEAVNAVMRQRQHRWVRNLLSLAKTDKRMRKLKHRSKSHSSSSRKNMRRGASVSASSGDADSQAIHVNRFVLSEGDVLFEEGDPCDAVYFIHKGELELKEVRNDHNAQNNQGDGNEMERKYLSAGDAIGLESFRDGATQTHTAICTKSRTVVSKIPKSTLDVLIRDHDYVSAQLKRHTQKVAKITSLDDTRYSDEINKKG